MSEFNYDSYCGIYCGACSILTAYKTGHKDPFACHWNESTAKEYQLAQGVAPADIEPFELKCHGCKTDTVFTNCKQCKIRKCTKSRKVDHCALDCADFPCEICRAMMENAKEVLDKLPHLKAAQKNIEAIKDVGVDRWLADQEKQWQCPDCGTTHSWYTFKCTKCGKDLEKLKDYNNL